MTYVMTCPRLYSTMLYLTRITTTYELKNFIDSRVIHYTVWYTANVSSRHIPNYVFSKHFYETRLCIMIIHKM
jgi:hypothetical protein